MQDSDVPSNTPLNQFDAVTVADYWLTEAEESLRVAEHLVEKTDYSYALFFGHLAIEKLLKALYALRLKEHAPPIHNLLRLARALGLELDQVQTDALIRISAFNIEAALSRHEARFSAHMHAGVHRPTDGSNQGDVRMAPISTSVMKSVERFLEAAQQRARIEAAYLYGSQAGGTAEPWSDIDLALVSADFAGDLFQERLALMRLAAQIDDRIEPYPFTPERFTVNDPLVSEICRAGLRLI